MEFDLSVICDELEKITKEKDKLSLNKNGYINGNVDTDILASALEK